MPTPELSLFVLKTRQVDKLREFYSLVGIEFSQEQHGTGPLHYAGRLGTIVFEIYPLKDDVIGVDTTSRLGFSVENLSQLVERLISAGTPIVSAPRASEWGLRAVVRDPDGRAVELSQMSHL